MPIDFEKLRDPEYQAQMRKQREEEERQREAKDKEIRGLVDKCMDAYDSLSEREQSFIRSCRTRINTYLLLSEAQEKWLRDIAGRL